MEMNTNNNQKLKVFLSYGHDENEFIVNKIKEYLEDTNKYNVWVDTSEIKEGDNWRQKIIDGIKSSDGVLSCLSEHAVRNGGVCTDEIKITLNFKDNTQFKTILLEPETQVNPPALITHNQWLDISDWREHVSHLGTKEAKIDEEYFNKKMEKLDKLLQFEEMTQFKGDLKTINKKIKPEMQNVFKNSVFEEEFIGREWLFKRFDYWSQNSNTEKVFLIQGIAGSGKTTISANLSFRNCNVVAIHFFRFDYYDSLDFDKFIDSLAFQLACKMPEYRTQLASLLKEASKSQRKKTENDRFEFLITNILKGRNIDRGRENVIIILDALDEVYQYNEKNNLGGGEKFINKICDLINSLNMPWLKFFVTTRPDTPILTAFERVDGGVNKETILDNNNPYNYEDIREYINKKLDKYKADSKFNAFKIARNADGCFLYAYYFCKAVKEKNIDLNNENTFPLGLNGFYIKDFERALKQEDLKIYKEALIYLSICDRMPLDVLKALTQLDGDQLNMLFRKLDAYIDCQKYKNSFTRVNFYHKSVKDWLLSSSTTPGNLYYTNK
ncbi:MAG: toll/interleukin-1 receptor domain-containing protein, partial [Coriobacteriales bacterium]|nr:toll/interleukin-1 receptor domain-containing protein [Coriobacteriales bacterium]